MKVWCIESTAEAPMTPIAMFRDEKLARDFAAMIGDAAVVDCRDVFSADQVDEVVTDAAQSVLDHVEAEITRAIKNADEGADVSQLEDLLENLEHMNVCDAASDAAREAVRRAA